MSQTYTLDDIRAATEARYGSCDIAISDTKVTKLRNPLRLSEIERDKLMAVQDRLSAEPADGEKVDQLGLIREALTIVAETPAQAKALLAAIGDDLAVLVQTFETYGKGTQVGEASASRD